MTLTYKIVVFICNSGRELCRTERGITTKIYTFFINMECYHSLHALFAVCMYCKEFSIFSFHVTESVHF